MYNNMTESIKKRMIDELKRFWQYDPNYPEITKNIQGKYSFRDRPQQGIIVKNASANTVQLSADNFVGTVTSYAVLHKVGNAPGMSIEWVRENQRAIRANLGVFPSPPGIYYIAVERETVDIGGQARESLVFHVDPLLKVLDEAPLKTGPLTWVVSKGSIHPGSLNVWELPGNIKLFEDINYTVDNTTGIITLAEPLPANVFLSVDYNYEGESSGPFVIRENHTNVAAIPGVVLAFGRRVRAEDRLAVVITDRRSEVALEYGGRWEINLDIDVMARDTLAQGEIVDRTMLYLWGVARNRLSSEGIEITAVAFGGESEEIYDENADDYFYNGAISVTLQSDWAIHCPLDVTIGRITPQTIAQAAASASLTDEERILQEEQSILAVQDLRLLSATDPFFRGRNRNYEVIK